MEGARYAANALHCLDADVDFYDAQLDIGATDASIRAGCDSKAGNKVTLT